jgi:hypothetical protein
MPLDADPDAGIVPDGGQGSRNPGEAHHLVVILVTAVRRADIAGALES